MSDGYKIAIDTESKNKLKVALSEFCDKHRTFGNAGIKGEIEDTAAKVKVAFEKVDHSIALIGGATALLKLIETYGKVSVSDRGPYPKG
jgi:hypothetical protein